VVKPSINLQFGDGLYKPFIWFWEWVCEFFCHMIYEGNENGWTNRKWTIFTKYTLL
jgi:hypothetical protein